MITIYHNPRCSKSREALVLVTQFASEDQLPLSIVEYLKTPPDLMQLQTLQRQLGCKVRDMMRTNEEEYAALNLQQADDATLLRAIAEHPKLLQRPIVTYRDRAAIGRPPELLRAFLEAR